ncbi:MAG: glycosyltransferase family 39 protein [Verrucomicrobia bacterium]|nr:glycosyltransferase family 39 protein [Verrucomicrobiota bacterium]
MLITRVIAGLVLVGAILLSPQAVLASFLPAAYSHHFEYYVKGLTCFKGLVAFGALVALAVPGWVLSAFQNDPLLPGSDVRPQEKATDWAFVGILTVAACLLRLIHLRPSFTYDEVFLVKSLILQNPIRTLVHPSGSSHALHTLLGNLSVRIFGMSEWSARLPALLFGSAAPAMIFVFLKRQVSHRIGIIAAVLLLITPIHVWFSQEAKGNVPQIAMVLWSWICISSLCRRWNRMAAAGLVVALFLSALAHLSGITFIVGQCLAVSLFSLKSTRRADTSRCRGRLAGLHAIAFYLVMTYYSVISFFLIRGGQNVTAKEGAAGVGEILHDVFVRFTALDVSPAFLLPIVGISLVGIIVLARERRDLLALACLPFLLGVGIIVAAGLFSHARYHTFALPGLILVVAAGVDGLWRLTLPESGAARSVQLVGRAAICVLLAFVIAVYVSALALYFRQPKSNLRQIAEFVAEAGADLPVYVIGVNKKCYPALGMTYYMEKFHTDDTVESAITRSGDNAEIMIAVIDTLHFTVGYKELRPRLLQAGAELARFSSLGELDQYRVRESTVYRVRVRDVADAIRTENVAHRVTLPHDDS